MEKKQQQQQQQSNSSGVCEKIFHAFHINSTFPTVRRLTLRQKEPVPAATEGLPTPSPPVTANGSSEKQHVRAKHMQPTNAPPRSKVVERKTTESAGRLTASAKSEKGRPPVLPSAGESKTAATAAASVAPPTGGPLKDSKGAKKVDRSFAEEAEKGVVGKPRRNINDKIDDYIIRTKNKMMTGLGKTPTSKP